MRSRPSPVDRTPSRRRSRRSPSSSIRGSPAARWSIGSSARPAITLATAPVVVGGGRGVGSADGFAPLEELAAAARRRRRVLEGGHQQRLAQPHRPGRPDRHADRPDRVLRVRHLRRHPALGRGDGGQAHRRHQHRPAGEHGDQGRLRRDRRPPRGRPGHLRRDPRPPAHEGGRPAAGSSPTSTSRSSPRCSPSARAPCGASGRSRPPRRRRRRLPVPDLALDRHRPRHRGYRRLRRRPPSCRRRTGRGR